MKRLFSAALAMVLLTFCVSCAKQKTLELPFSAADVKQIELHRFHVPTAAEQKIVTSQEDIQNIIKTLESVNVKENKLEAAAGADVTSFRFNLTDGTDFEMIYVSHSVKKGEIKTSNGFEYQTTADVGAIWNNCDSDSISVEEDTLPQIG